MGATSAQPETYGPRSTTRMARETATDRRPVPRSQAASEFRRVGRATESVRSTTGTQRSPPVTNGQAQGPLGP